MAEQDDVLHLIDDSGTAPEASTARRWKVAVIDDDQAVHEGTRFALSDYNLNGQTLEILSAYSAAEGRTLMRAHPDIAAVFSHAEESSWGAQLAIARAKRCKDNIRQYTFDGSNAGFKAVKAGTFGADGNYTPFIADIGLRAALYKLMGKDIPGQAAYDMPGQRLQLPDSPTVVPENAAEWVGRGWGNFEPTPDPCK